MATVPLEEFEVVVFDIVDECVEALVEQGPPERTRPSSLARRADVVFLSLPSDAALESAVLGDDGVVDCLTSGDVLINTSTASLRGSRRGSQRPVRTQGGVP